MLDFRLPALALVAFNIPLGRFSGSVATLNGPARRVRRETNRNGAFSWRTYTLGQPLLPCARITPPNSRAQISAPTIRRPRHTGLLRSLGRLRGGTRYGPALYPGNRLLRGSPTSVSPYRSADSCYCGLLNTIGYVPQDRSARGRLRLTRNNCPCALVGKTSACVTAQQGELPRTHCLWLRSFISFCRVIID